MYKTRIIPILLLRNARCVKGINFSTDFRDTGWPPTAAKIYDSQDADELIVLDIDATNENRKPNFEIFDEVSRNCFMPLTLGGGIRNIDDIHELLKVGADKVAINTAAIEKPEIIGEAAKRFGSQCVVVAIDAKKVGGANGKYHVVTHSGKKDTGMDSIEWAKKAEKLGAGEILLTSIDNEGTMNGYDLELTRKVADAVTIPVIANGGAGKLHHFKDAIVHGRASAAAASSIFHFTDQSVIKARAYMKEHGINVRIV